MASYKLKIDTAASGFDGIVYDIVFMEHMMSNMGAASRL
jgi:hypothetical protein